MTSVRSWCNTSRAAELNRMANTPVKIPLIAGISLYAANA